MASNTYTGGNHMFIPSIFAFHPRSGFAMVETWTATEEDFNSYPHILGPCPFKVGDTLCRWASPMTGEIMESTPDNVMLSLADAFENGWFWWNMMGVIHGIKVPFTPYQEGE